MEGVHKELIVVSTHNIHHCICTYLWKSNRLCNCSINCHHDRCGYVSIVILLQYPAQCSFISQYRHGKDTRLSSHVLCPKCQRNLRKNAVILILHFSEYWNCCRILLPRCDAFLCLKRRNSFEQSSMGVK